jgi:hypothetical protein
MPLRNRIVIVHGAPFFLAPSPLDTYLRPLIDGLGIEIQVVERADPIVLSIFSDVDRLYAVSHSHGTNWFEIVLGHIPWWPRENKIGWSSIDGVRFTMNDATDVSNPQYDPQTRNIPFKVPGSVNICRGYHRKLPVDRTVAANNLPLALLNFPFNSLLEPTIAGQDLVDKEVTGSVGTVFSTFNMGGAASAAISAALTSQIDHNSIVAAVAQKVVADIRAFFGLGGGIV